MEYREIGKTGLKVSSLSFGGSSLGSVFRGIDEQEGIRTVTEAVENGINYIDVSPYYGITKAETVLGKAIKDINRDRFFLSTKVGRYGENEFDFSKEKIFSSVEESLNRLQTDYIDILYLHDIEFGSYNQIVEESIPALNELKKQGKIRFTGISGLPLKAFEDVLEKQYVDAVLSYCHYSLNDQSLVDFVPYLDNKNVGLVSASPLSMGLLTGRKIPDWHPANDKIKEACKKAADFCQEQGEDLAKLAIQFSVENAKIPTTLVSTGSVENIKKNISWVEQPINHELLNQVLQILDPVMNLSWSSGNYKELVK
ncbi:aldo/keto reductase [Peribacillus sp. NPDC097225]|uniref:aldo/keto reductase n=1 Tax=Peribacillus sp. NPDC097225 TaxID=3364400 RepID=UPI0037FCAD63